MGLSNFRLRVLGVRVLGCRVVGYSLGFRFLRLSGTVWVPGGFVS